MLEDGRRAIIARHAAPPSRLFLGDLLSLAIFGAVAGLAMGVSVLALAGLTGLNPMAAARVDTLSQIHGIVGLIAIVLVAGGVGRRHGTGPGQALLGLRGVDEEGRRTDVRYLFVRLVTNLLFGGAVTMLGPIAVGLLQPGPAGAVALVALAFGFALWLLAFRTDASGRTAGHAAASMVVLPAAALAAYRADLQAEGLLDVSPYWTGSGDPDPV